MLVRPGARLGSAIDTVEVVVVRMPDRSVLLECRGVEMAADVTGGVSPDAPHGGVDGVMIGKRYVDDDGTIELLCTRAGIGPLAADGVVLRARETRPLPASD